MITKYIPFYGYVGDIDNLMYLNDNIVPVFPIELVDPTLLYYLDTINKKGFYETATIVEGEDFNFIVTDFYRTRYNLSYIQIRFYDKDLELFKIYDWNYFSFSPVFENGKCVDLNICFINDRDNVILCENRKIKNHYSLDMGYKMLSIRDLFSDDDVVYSKFGMAS